MHSNMSRFIKSFNLKRQHIKMSSLSSQDTDLDDGLWSIFCQKHRICQETSWFISYALQTNSEFLFFRNNWTKHQWTSSKSLSYLHPLKALNCTPGFPVYGITVTGTYLALFWILPSSPDEQNSNCSQVPAFDLKALTLFSVFNVKSRVLTCITN